MRDRVYMGFLMSSLWCSTLFNAVLARGVPPGVLESDVGSGEEARFALEAIRS